MLGLLHVEEQNTLATEVKTKQTKKPITSELYIKKYNLVV